MSRPGSSTTRATDPGWTRRSSPASPRGWGCPSDPTGSVAARAVHAWTSLFGLINFELFGHTHNVVVEDEKFFTASTARLAAELGVR